MDEQTYRIYVLSTLQLYWSDFVHNIYVILSLMHFVASEGKREFQSCPKEIYSIQLTFSSPLTSPWLTVCAGLGQGRRADKYRWVVGKNNAALSAEYLHRAHVSR